MSDIDEIGVRDGANRVVTDDYGRGIFAPSFRIWPTTEECFNPPLIYEKERGWFAIELFSEPEIFDFPAGIGPLECVNVEHEDVVPVPRFLDANRVTFKYDLKDDFIGVLKTLHLLGLDKSEPVTVRIVLDAKGLRDLVRVSPAIFWPQCFLTRQHLVIVCREHPARACG